MSKFHLTNKVIEDLSEIWEYTYDAWSEKQADEFYSYLLNSFQEIIEYPKVGKKYNELGTTILGYLASKQIIFYQIISKKEI